MRQRTLDDTQGDHARAVRVFIAYLNELPLDARIDAARRRALVPQMADAEMTLHGVVRQLDHRAVFATKNAVLQALQRFDQPGGRHLTRPRFATEHLRLATENAALPVVAHPNLSSDEFKPLSAPFEPTIPVALLFGLPE